LVSTSGDACAGTNAAQLLKMIAATAALEESDIRMIRIFQ
jgi:hypothetical protein